jgi:hypothetical protein
VRLEPFLNTQSIDREGVDYQVSPGEFITLLFLVRPPFLVAAAVRLLWLLLLPVLTAAHSMKETPVFPPRRSFVAGSSKDSFAPFVSAVGSAFPAPA